MNFQIATLCRKAGFLQANGWLQTIRHSLMGKGGTVDLNYGAYTTIQDESLILTNKPECYDLGYTFLLSMPNPNLTQLKVADTRVEVATWFPPP